MVTGAGIEAAAALNRAWESTVLKRAMTRMDLPSEPEESGRLEQASAAAERLRSKPPELPDPDERTRVYEATRAHAEADAAERPEQVHESGQRPELASPSYWSEVSRFRRMWADHKERWPTGRQPAAGADWPADPPGSYRSNGGFPLSPERHTETIDAISRARKAEPAISADMQTAERENTSGSWLEGFDHRLKGDDRLKEKVADKLRDQPDSLPADVVRRIPDTIRYTFCLEPIKYAAGYYDIKQRLEERGYEMYYSKNWWPNSEYKGINTRWVTEEGNRFEVQFHTPESFHAKHDVSHTAYERLRNSLTSRRELRELHLFQQEVSSCIQIPNNATDIPDYEKEGL